MNQKVYVDLVKQIRDIAMNGCNGIKCKYCVLKSSCDRMPVHSKSYAQALINYSKMASKNADSKN